MRTLHLLRHAKSSWDEVGLEDHDRPLNRRGARAAELIAAHLAEQPAPPDLILGSTARRVRETIEALLRVVTPERVTFERGLYQARSAALLERLRAIDDRTSSVLLVGHNPALHELALALATAEQRTRLPAIHEKFPTGALATFEIGAAWRRLTPESADLLAYRIPRDLAPVTSALA